MKSGLEESFPLFKKSDWLEAFIREAGNEATNSFVIDGISYGPYYTAEDVEGSGYLPKATEHISLGQVFDFRNGQKPVDELKRSLSHDFGAPVFLIDKTTDIDSFTDIQMEYIFQRFHLYDEVAIEFITKLTENYKSKNWQPSFVCEYEQTQKSIPEGQMHYFKYETNDNLAGFINSFCDKLDKLETFDPGQVIFNTRLSGQFIHDIVKVRAIKIAWFNYLESRGLPLEPFINEITWDTDKPYPEVLLEHSNNVVAAILAQADHISLDLTGTADANRIMRNSCHIALIESHLGDEPDPCAGSYFLEFVSADLAKRAFMSSGFFI